ncbi:MAG TPA: NAD(P)-binding protein [Phycisphaerae bacterium]|nr:NAD(P)-binding protein [Phycisphaerae bacterium]
MPPMNDHVIIAGFGVGGRFIAEYLKQHRIPFVIVEMNPETCATQRTLGIETIHGDITDEAILRQAGVESANVLALALPDEAAALRATEVANRLCPEIHIIAATRYTSTGLSALQKGADEVIVAEQAVAHEFYRRISAFMSRRVNATT